MPPVCHLQAIKVAGLQAETVQHLAFVNICLCIFQSVSSDDDRQCGNHDYRVNPDLMLRIKHENS
ncbi:hypothetical protein RCT24_13095, partial [Escherichia coli]|nr:hypothetical protein [Escherichia coli]